MKYHVQTILLVLLLLTFIFSCNQETEQTGSKESYETVSDYLGRTLSLPKNPAHIICSGAGCLRYVVYLQCQDRIWRRRRALHSSWPLCSRERRPSISTQGCCTTRSLSTVWRSRYRRCPPVPAGQPPHLWRTLVQRMPAMSRILCTASRTGY